MIRRLSVALAAAVLLAVPAQAQVPLLDVRVGAHAVLPTGTLADNYETGYGAYARLGIPAGPIRLMGTLSYNLISGKRINPLVEYDDETVLGLTVGPHLALPMIDAGLEFGYFSNFEELGIVPSVSIAFGKLDVTASYTHVNYDPKSQWFALGLGLRF